MLHTGTLERNKELAPEKQQKVKMEILNHNVGKGDN